MSSFFDLIFEITKYKQELGADEQKQVYWRQQIKKYVGRPNTFIHFANVPKFGINFKNEWGTPTGFYAYPFDLNKLSSFGAERPYIFVFETKPSARFLKFPAYSHDDFEIDKQKLSNSFPAETAKVLENSSLGWRPYNKIMNLTKYLSEELVTNSGGTYDSNHTLFKWSSILKNTLGYDGVIDDCTSTIHEAEECQAVFFNINSLNLLEMFKKPTSYGKFSKIMNDGQTKKLSGDLTGKELQFYEKTLLFKADVSNSQFLKSFDEITFAQVTGKNVVFLNNVQPLNISNSTFEKTIIHSLVNSKIKQTKFLESIISNLETTNIKTTKFIDCNFENGILYCGFNSCDFQNCFFKKENITNVILESCAFNSSKFNKTYFESVTFNDCNLSQAMFQDCVFKNCSLNKTKTNKDNFINCSFINTETNF